MTEPEDSSEQPPRSAAFAAWLEQLRREPDFLAWLDPSDEEDRDDEPPRAAYSP